MKAILIAFFCIVAFATGAVIINARDDYRPRNLGERRCTWGPSYWCQNLTNSAECKTTNHCIKHVWENMTVPVDNDDVCSICKDMVKQARDQLESNQTQEDLKAVFEGSCRLMVLKPVVKECQKLADEFIPELVETLASQMDPSVVCTVSGLCNSRKIDNLIFEYQKKDVELKKENPNKMKAVSLKNDEAEPDECSKCFTITKIMKNKLDDQKPEDISRSLLQICGKLGSYSDSCVYLVTKYSESIYNLKYEFTPKNICHLSGQCSGKFHQHEDEVDTSLDVEIRPMSSVGMVDVNDDLPCKLCAQLVGHLRDLLVANSTEDEFKTVMEGICTQTGKFSSECKSIVDEYYSEIYEYLVNKLDGNIFCEMAGICPAPGQEELDVPFMPLLPSESLGEASKLMGKVFKEKEQKIVYTFSEADEMQLPIERFQGMSSLLNFPNMDVEGEKTCKICQEVVHYIQQFVTESRTMTEIEEEMDKVCAKLSFLNGTCVEFVTTYGDYIIAMLAQAIDPSTVCPILNVCLSKEMMVIWKSIPKEYMIEIDEGKSKKEKPTCPLCLFAVEQIYQAIQNDKTEASIKKELDKLCSHFSSGMKEKCVDFVDAYTEELIRMLLKDMKPQDICEEIKLCVETKSLAPQPAISLFPLDDQGQIMTNEIPDYPVESVKSPIGDVECKACEAVMNYLEKKIQDKQTEDEIKKIVHGACPYVFGYEKQCNDFVNQYGDLIIDMLVDQVKPADICVAIKLCVTENKRFQESLNECDLCQTVASTVNRQLTNPNVNHEIETVLEDICNLVPSKMQGKCELMMDTYKPSVINIVKKDKHTRNICKAIAFCSATDLYVMYNKSYRHYFNQ